ncbi:MAG: hypothetical protein CVV44_17210 [Spirochaetae bacterium HGW-Spirochaetae-1]|jgi:RNA polymerase sigma factor (sigma-70 family)|nr:MAG: hypothetical protein CVV44_17210 [Spirochaetae bacterium HGW-Spirochaetae-1]
MAVDKKKRDRFSEMYIEYFPLVMNALFTKVGNKEDANDICQEVFILLYEKFDEVLNVRKWLFGTLRYVTCRYYEQKSKNREQIDRLFDDIALTFTNGFRDTRIIINEAIEKADMSEEEKLIFDYIAVYNYSYSNVGDILGLSKRQIGYKFIKIVNGILEYLKVNHGIESIEELL